MAGLIRVADYIFEFFANHGVRTVFLVPGGGSMFLVDAVSQNARIDYVANHHEQASVIAAEAYARISGGIGVAVVTTGPGATNAITGVAGAWLESAPVFVVSGQVKRADLKGDSGLRQRGPQEIDIVTMVASITKYAVTVMEPQDIRYHLERAFNAATTGRTGPVWLDVPLDVQASLIDPTALRFYLPDATGSYENQRFVDQIDAVIALLKASERPLLLGGQGVRLAGAAKAFERLYELLNIPVAVTWPAIDLIPSTHRLSVGKPGAVAQRSANFIVQSADLLIIIGVRLDNAVTAFNRDNFGRNARRIIVDIDPQELAKFVGRDDDTILADARDFIELLIRRAEPVMFHDNATWLSHCKLLEERYPLAEDTRAIASTYISHYRAAHALSTHIPEGALVVTGSSGLAIEFLYAGFRTKPGQRLMHTAGLGAMGYGVPAMIGAWAAYGKSFVGIESDGSLMFNLQELLTIRALQIPVCLFILNNGGYASIRNTQRTYFAGRYVATGIEAKLLLADAVAFGATIGIPGIAITEASALDGAIRHALAQPGPFICDIVLEPNETLWPKVASIPMPDGTLVSMPLEDMSPLLPRDELRANMVSALDPVSERVRAGGGEVAKA